MPKDTLAVSRFAGKVLHRAICETLDARQLLSALPTAGSIEDQLTAYTSTN